MTDEKLEKIYRLSRRAVFAIPAIVVLVGIYLILFPVDDYKFFPNDPKLSKFIIEKDANMNQLSFGVFPLRNYRYIQLSLNFEKSKSADCRNAIPEVNLQKSYQAFLYPTGEIIPNKDELRRYLFDENKTKYPNGSLLHLKPTNEVFLISRGKKILFPGPEIFEAFGYNFSNLIDVEQSDIDQFSDADKRVFLWTMPHPDGTIFQSFPSHSLYLVFEGKKYPIENRALLDEIWPESFLIPVSDPDPKDILKCSPENASDNISCLFDSSMLSNIGRYYHFDVKYPKSCSVNQVQSSESQIRFSSEKSITTMKDSLKNIVASVLNRYLYKQ